MNETKMNASNQLQFLKRTDWMRRLTNLLNTETAKKFKGLLVRAGKGISECMDERKSLTKKEISSNEDFFSVRDLEAPKPAMVGGAAGWATYFMLTGQTMEQAVKSTKKLYEKMNWGEMQVHIDDGHGTINSPEELKKRKKGCGFLKVVQDVVNIAKELLLEDNDIVSKEKVSIDGEELFSQLVTAGSKVVPLTGHHRTDEFEAKVVINNMKEKTLNRDVINESNPAFLWDAWATTNQEVLSVFNNLAGKNLDQEQFIKLQTTVHLATGLMLNAINFGKHGNVVMLNS